MTKHIKKISISIICIMLLLFSGCWNNRDLTEMGVIVGMGIDEVENNEIELTIQLTEPTLNDEIKQVGKNRTWRSISARGSSVFEANRNLLTKVNKKLNYSNIQLMIIGENLAKNGIDNVLDFFQRVHEIDKREVILISEGIKPKEIFNIESEQGLVSAVEIGQTLKNTDRLPAIRKMNMYDLILNISGESNSVVGMVKVSEVNEPLKISNLNFNGAAVLKKDKLVGWLDSKETYGVQIVDSKIKNPIITVPNPIASNEQITIEITKCISKKNILFNNDNPAIYVEVYAEGKMVEQHGKGNLTSAERIRELEAATSEEIKKVVSNTIKNAQINLRTDIFGFGKNVHSKNLFYWKEVKDNWDDTFSGLSTVIKVNYKNKDMGFIKAHK